MNNKMITIREDGNKLNDIDRTLATQLMSFNAILKDVRNYSTIESKESFVRAYNDLKEYLTNEQVQQLPKPLKMLSNVALKGLINLPNYEGAELKIKALKKSVYSTKVLNCLELVDDSFILNEEAVEQWKDGYRIKISDPEQIKRYEDLKELADIVNKLGLYRAHLNSILRVFAINEEGLVAPKPTSVINGY